jgi:ribosomal protein S6
MEQMNLVKNSSQREYEVTYLLTGDLLDADVAKIRKEITDAVVKLKGKVIEEFDWERKLLAYKVRHAGKAHQEAIFTHLIVQLPPEKIRKLNKELDLHRQVMRQLIVQREANESVEKKKSDSKKVVKKIIKKEASKK